MRLRQPRAAAHLACPNIVEAILGGRQPAEMTLAVLMRPFAVEWREQRAEILGRTEAANIKPE